MKKPNHLTWLNWLGVAAVFAAAFLVTYCKGG